MSANIKNKIVIREIYNLIPVIEMFRQDGLVIFGIDNVLTIPSDEDDFRNQCRAKLWQSIKYRLTSKKIEFLESIIMANSKKILIDHRIVDVFDHMKSQQIPSIALTAINSGDFGIIKHMQDFKIKELNMVGISFENLTPFCGEYLISELKNSNFAPMLASGVVLTAGIDKGLVLEYIFSKYNYYPKSIIFVDDCVDNFESLKNLCIKFKIDFHGFYYKAASLLPLPIIDEELEKWRFDILEQECVWLNYKKLRKKYSSHDNYYLPKVNQFLSWVAGTVTKISKY